MPAIPLDRVLEGWGGSPSNRGTCRSCGRPIAWGRTLHGKSLLLEPQPYPFGTVILRRNGTHLADLEDQVFFDPRVVDVARESGMPLFRKHRCSGPRTRGAPIRLGETLPRSAPDPDLGFEA